MKRLTALAISALMAFVLIGCGEKPTKKEDAAAAAKTESTNVQKPAETSTGTEAPAQH